MKKKYLINKEKNKTHKNINLINKLIVKIKKLN